MRTAVVLTALCLLPLWAHAHEGTLDAEGGHRDSETGAYHCHEEPCFTNQAKKSARPEVVPTKARRPVTKGTPAPAKAKETETEEAGEIDL